MLIEQMNAKTLQDEAAAFSELLALAVGAGASIGFVQPFTHEDASEFWLNRTAPLVENAQSLLFVARIEGRVVGTVQLMLPVMANQQHKADVAKMMVHPDFRRRGIAAALLEALIQAAVDRGLRLLALDTRTGDPAQSLYAKFGFERAGEIPCFARDPHDPNKFDGTTYMYKVLS